MRWSLVALVAAVLTLMTGAGLATDPSRQIQTEARDQRWVDAVNTARESPSAFGTASSRPAGIAGSNLEPDVPITSNEVVDSATAGIGQSEANPVGDDPSGDDPSGDDPSGDEDVSDYRFLRQFPGPGKSVFGVNTRTGGAGEVATFAKAAGVHPNLLLLPVGWGSDPWNEWLVSNVTDRGMMPMISWEPWDPSGGGRGSPERQSDYSLEQILAGRHDEYIDTWAAGLAQWGHPVMLRFAHEMNGSWYPWAEGRNGNDRGSYVEAWRYVHDRFTAAGADEVQWVWSPNVSYAGAAPLERFYPGDEYVDLLGVVGYFGHQRVQPTDYPTFDDLFGPTLTELVALSAKPIVITETGATEWGGFKAAWIDDFFDGLDAHPEILGFVWFELDKETDWRIVSSPEATASFAARIGANPRYDASVPLPAQLL